MAIQPSLVQYEWSELRRKRVEVGRLYDDGFLYLQDDPRVWVESDHDSVSSVRSLELNLYGYKGERIGDSIGKLSQLTHLSIYGGFCNLKCLRNTLSRLHHLHHLVLDRCNKLEELPANLGDLKFLASLFVNCARLRWLPWSITKLSNLRILYLPQKFRLETLPPHLNDSIIISVAKAHIRKTWKELKTHVTETLSYQFPIIPEEFAAQKTSTPGYLQFKGDPTLRIRDYNNYGLLSSLRVLDLDLGHCSYQGKIPDSIGELSQLTHLYISKGCLPHHLPPTFSRLTHLSLIHCTFECHTISHFDSLGNLSTLTSLHLYQRYNKLLPEHMDLPMSLTHLSLDFCYSSFPDSHMASMVGKLSNLNTLTLSECGDLESLPLHLNLTKLILRNTTIKSLPIALKHLEFMHSIRQCMFKSCNQMQECLENQLVNLKTLSYTCDLIKHLSSMIRLHNFRELKLKDCFSLQELPQDLDKLVKLCTLDVSGTRIQSLPNSIINLHNLRRLILPKCFKLDTLPPDFENKVMISVDDTDESYYKHEDYHYRHYGIINDCDYMTSDSIKEINEKFLEKFKQATITIIEQASPHRPSNHQPDATRIIEGSLLNGSADPTCNNNHNAFSSSLTQELEILPTRNEAGTKPDVVAELFSNNAPMDFEDYLLPEENYAVDENNSPAVSNSQNQETEIWQSNNQDGVVTDKAAEPSSNNLHETNSVGLSNQQVFRNERIANILELEQGTSSSGSLKAQDNNSHRVDVQHKTQKIRDNISLERINELKSQNLTLEAAAEHLDVSRSTLKRRLKELDITWSSSKKKKNPDKNRNETHSTCERNLSQLNSIDASNPASHGQGVENLAGSSQPTLSSHVPSAHNVVNNSTPDVVTTTVGEPPLSTQYCMDSRLQRVEEHPNDGVREPALVNTDLPPNERCSTFVVKATFNEDTTRFNFSLSSSIEKLKEEVGKSLDLEVDTFKIRYLDDEEEWMLMNRISDLELALNLSRASGSNVVRLSISLKT